MAAHARHTGRRINYVQTGVYLCLALVVCLTFWLDDRNQNQNKIELCKAGEDTRSVQRATVEAIYNLATGFAQRDASAPPLTPEEVERYNAYIERVNQFRDDMYDKIKPSKICAPYVDDDNVKPPTPPVPSIQKENAT